jgi:hypothetical protein
MPTRFTTIDAPSAIDSDAYGINNAGQIVGAYNNGSLTQGYLLSGGSYTSLNVPTAPLPNPITVAADINSSDQIVGYYDFEINRKSFQYSNGTYSL